MAQQTQAIEVPHLGLRACGVAEHCRALQRIRTLPFWWYLGRSRALGNFSIPFEDGNGHWWYAVKPGLCWSADCFNPIDARRARPRITKSFLGYQHIVPEAAQANSQLVVNAITSLAAYSEAAVDSKRRNSVRKGFRSCTLEVLTGYHAETFEQCRITWKELTERTGWKHAVERSEFEATWRAMLDCPGVSIILGRERTSGQVAGFLITKIIGDTAYVDTIASRTEFMKYNVNDAVMYAFLINAQRLDGVSKAHYAIRSYVETLEKFKQGLGFVPTPFPARTVLRGGVRLVLSRFFPDKYKRMIGQFDEPAAEASAARPSGPDASAKSVRPPGPRAGSSERDVRSAESAAP